MYNNIQQERSKKMKKITLALVLCLVLATPALGATNGVYGGFKFLDAIQSTGHVSRNFSEARPSLDYFSANTVGGALFIGYDLYYKFQVPVRFEVEYAIRTLAQKDFSESFSPVAGVNVKNTIDYQYNVQTLFANAYYDFRNSTAFTPYIGAGVGLGFIHSNMKLKSYVNGVNVETRSPSSFDTVFAWNVGAGCSYAFTENFSLDLSYRFVGYGPTKISYQDWSPATGWETHTYNTLPNAHEFALGARFTF